MRPEPFGSRVGNWLKTKMSSQVTFPSSITDDWSKSDSEKIQSWCRMVQAAEAKKFKGVQSLAERKKFEKKGNRAKTVAKTADVETHTITPLTGIELLVNQLNSVGMTDIDVVDDWYDVVADVLALTEEIHSIDNSVIDKQC